jgi:hypothetical protein
MTIVAANLGESLIKRSIYYNSKFDLEIWRFGDLVIKQQ